MAEKSFAAGLIKKSGEPDDLFQCVKKDTQLTGRAFMVRFKYKDRKPDFVMWALANDGGFLDEGPDHECLVLIFAQRVVYIRGHFLEYALPIIETERALEIREADRATAMLLMAHNQSASENGILPVVTSIEVKPDLQTRINQVLKEEELHEGH